MAGVFNRIVRQADMPSTETNREHIKVDQDSPDFKHKDINDYRETSQISTNKWTEPSKVPKAGGARLQMQDLIRSEDQ